MTRFITAAAAVFLIGFTSVPVAAQTGPLFHVRLLQIQQEQIDQLQRRLDGPTDWGLRAYLDVVVPLAPPVVWVSGWGFNCTGEPTKVVLMVDGIATANVSARFPRSDVETVHIGCRFGEPVGLFGLIDMTGFEPSLNDDGRHRFAIRLYDADGHMFESNTKHAQTFSQPR